jgi:hydrogenase maturation protease
MTRTLIIGLGNPILTDDGVGIQVARALCAALPPDASVDVRELSVGGLALMESMIGYERVILIDALLTPGSQPGALRRLSLDNLGHALNTASSHDMTLPMALAVGRRLGAALPDDDAIVILGIEVQDVLTFSEACTGPVAAAIPAAVQMALAILAERTSASARSGE